MAMAAEKRETSTLIGSDKVEGTNVYRSTATRSARSSASCSTSCSGKVAYAVMSFGGFLGIGEELLSGAVVAAHLQHQRLGGYEVNVSRARSSRARRNTADDDDWDWDDRERAQQVYDYYRVAPYWM